MYLSNICVGGLRGCLGEREGKYSRIQGFEFQTGRGSLISCMFRCLGKYLIVLKLLRA